MSSLDVPINFHVSLKKYNLYGNYRKIGYKDKKEEIKDWISKWIGLRKGAGVLLKSLTIFSTSNNVREGAQP